MVPLEQVALLHKVSYQLLSEDHHIVRLDFKRHAALRKLAVNQ